MRQTVVLGIALLLICSAGGQVFANELTDIRISTLFYETDIREALGELVLQTGINIIYDETVRGIVTLDLDEVPFEQALRMLLIGGGYTYRRLDGFYLVGLADPRSPMFPSLVETETVRLQYLTAGEARSLLPTFYDRYLRVPGEGYTMTVTGPPDIIARLREDLAKVDTPQQEILIKALVTEVSTEFLEELGGSFFNWSTQGAPNWDSDGVFSIGLPTPGTVTLGSSLFGQLEARIRALEQDDLAKVRANPQIRVIDRRTANLFVGDTRHIILTPEGAASRLERVDVGVTLNVTPRVLGDNQIHLTITPEISHVTDERREDLVVRRSEMSTSLFLRSGEMVLLAGMTVDDILRQERKVPILGDIPLLRLFFRQTIERQGERELLVFITAEILEKESL